MFAALFISALMLMHHGPPMLSSALHYGHRRLLMSLICPFFFDAKMYFLIFCVYLFAVNAWLSIGFVDFSNAGKSRLDLVIYGSL